MTLLRFFKGSPGKLKICGQGVREAYPALYPESLFRI